MSRRTVRPAVASNVSKGDGILPSDCLIYMLRIYTSKKAVKRTAPGDLGIITGLSIDNRDCRRHKCSRTGRKRDSRPIWAPVRKAQLEKARRRGPTRSETERSKRLAPKNCRQTIS